MENKKPILVIGIGNLIIKDEGVGIHVVRRMNDMSLPPSVELLDGGILATSWLYLIEGRKKVIVIVTMKGGGQPGTIYRFTDKEIGEKRKGYFRTIEEQEFTDDVKTSRIMGTPPDEVIFLGIEPEDTGEESFMLEIALSPTLESKMPEIIEMVMKEIETKS